MAASSSGGATDTCITEFKVVEAAKRIKSNKAPGLDGISGAEVKAVVLARPDIFRDTFQQCFTDGVFSKRWKSQKLVLLPKGKGPDMPQTATAHYIYLILWVKYWSVYCIHE